MKIIFASPGLGKTYFLRNNTSNWIDCDSVIELTMNKSTSELCKDREIWNYCKSNIISWKIKHFPNHNLLTGKARLIPHCSEVLLHLSTDEMKKRLVAEDRPNPIDYWDCDAEEADYISKAIEYQIPIKRIKYLSDYLIIPIK